MTSDLPGDMPLRLGALAEPLTSCIRAFSRRNRRFGALDHTNTLAAAAATGAATTAKA